MVIKKIAFAGISSGLPRLGITSYIVFIEDEQPIKPGDWYLYDDRAIILSVENLMSSAKRKKILHISRYDKESSEAS